MAEGSWHWKAALTASTLLAAACTELPATRQQAVADTVPPGVVAAVPFQNRPDVAQGIFQLKVYNGTDEAVDVRWVQLVWAGLTTPVSPRSNRVAAGDRVDFPVPLVDATCRGDGSSEAMPDLGEAVARVGLADGSVVDASVYDVFGVARRLYAESCSRQRVAATVVVEWVDVRPAERTDVTIDGVTYPSLPATAASLRLTRRPGTDFDAPIAVLEVKGTLIFAVEATGVVSLPPRHESAQLDVLIVESRCDAHARSEATQPFEFSVRIDLGDGVARPYTVRPATSDRGPMRQRAEAACDARGDSGFVGQSEAVSAPAAGR